MTPTQTTDPKRILNVEDLRRLTGWSKSTIYKLTSNGTLKHSKPCGKTLFFDRGWIEAFLLGTPNTTNAENEQRAINHLTLNS